MLPRLPTVRAIGKDVRAVALSRASWPAMSWSSPSLSRWMSSEGGGDSTASVEAAAGKIRDHVKTLDDMLVSTYGGDTSSELWMQTLYKHGEADLLVPAVIRMTQSNAEDFDLVVDAKTIMFTSQVLRHMSEEEVKTQFSRFFFSGESVSADIVLSSLYAADTPATRACFDQFHKFLQQTKKGSAFSDLAEHLLRVPLAPLDLWPIPTEDEEFQATWKDTTSVYEVSGNLARVKENLNEFHDWGLLCTSTLLEASWTAFYATGDPSHLSRVLTIATPWKDFSSSLSIDYVMHLDKPVPTDLVEPHSLDSIRLSTSRLAMWQLMAYSRLHAAIMERLGHEISGLGNLTVQPSYRTEAMTAEEEAAATRRLGVMPLLAYLIAQVKLDSPHEAP